MRNGSLLVATALVAGSALVSGSAGASVTWRFDDGNAQANCVSNCTGWQTTMTFGNANNSAETGPDVIVSGYSNTGNLSAVTPTDSQALASRQEAAQMYRYSGGIGIKNADATSSTSSFGDPSEGVTPEHAIDNNGRYDWVLLDFGIDQIALNSLSIEWPTSGYDSDMTVLWHDDSVVGADAGVAGKTFQELMDDGWKLVANLANVVAGAQTGFNGSGTMASSHWLVGAYNPYFSTANWTTGNDYMKLATVSGDVVTLPPNTPSAVAEPGSLALFAFGMAGFAGVRRRARSVTSA